MRRLGLPLFTALLPALFAASFTGCAASSSHSSHRGAAEMAAPGAPIEGADLEVQGLLGEGGMGRVLLARQHSLRRDVALKVFFSKDELPSLHEARQLARVEHPSVVRVHSLGAHEGAHFVVTELVRGDALEQHLSRGTRVPLPTVAHVLDQILAGLDAIHGVGLAHGDLKPGNVIVGTFWLSGQIGAESDADGPRLMS